MPWRCYSGSAPTPVHASNAAQTRRTTSQNVYDTPGQWLVTHSWASGVQSLGSGAGGMQSTYSVLGQTSETPPPQDASIPTATTNKILSRIGPPSELNAELVRSLNTDRASNGKRGATSSNLNDQVRTPVCRDRKFCRCVQLPGRAWTSATKSSLQSLGATAMLPTRRMKE